MEHLSPVDIDAITCDLPNVEEIECSAPSSASHSVEQRRRCARVTRRNDNLATRTWQEILPFSCSRSSREVPPTHAATLANKSIKPPMGIEPRQPSHGNLGLTATPCARTIRCVCIARDVLYNTAKLGNYVRCQRQRQVVPTLTVKRQLTSVSTVSPQLSLPPPQGPAPAAWWGVGVLACDPAGAMLSSHSTNAALALPKLFRVARGPSIAWAAPPPVHTMLRFRSGLHLHGTPLHTNAHKSASPPLHATH